MYSFTLPYIHSGPGFPIVLVGTFNKAKDIKAPSLNIVSVSYTHLTLPTNREV